MKKYKIPTASYAVFTDAGQATDYVRRQKMPLVLKADGLAAGKGVVIAQHEDEAVAAVNNILEGSLFGAAGNRLIVEEHLDGEEVTVLAVCDGKHILPLVSSQDHKRIYAGDRGPNTGGMGAYSPVPALTPDLFTRVEQEILKPAIYALAAEGFPFTGVLYAGVMLTAAGPKVLEYNARFGDPETQAVLPRLETDLVDLIEAAIRGELDQIQLAWNPNAALTVVLASAGYPGPYKTGYVIEGIDEAMQFADTHVFQAGTACVDGKTVTAGGRVLAVTGLGHNLKIARECAYTAAEKIKFQGCYLRPDIGWRALSSP